MKRAAHLYPGFIVIDSYEKRTSRIYAKSNFMDMDSGDICRASKWVA